MGKTNDAKDPISALYTVWMLYFKLALVWSPGLNTILEWERIEPLEHSFEFIFYLNGSNVHSPEREPKCRKWI